MKKGERLTLKQRRFIKLYTDPNSPTFGNQSKSALAAGYKNEVAGKQNVHKENIKEEINRILEKQGFTDEMMFKRLIGIIKDYDESSKDRTNALQGLRLLWELKDSFPSKKIEEKIEGLESIDRKALEELKEILKGSLQQGRN